MFTENLSVFFNDAEFATIVTFGALTANAIFDAFDETLLDNDVISTSYSITYKYGDLAGLGRGSSVTIDGAAYTVNKIIKLDAGKILKATLSKT